MKTSEKEERRIVREKLGLHPIKDATMPLRLFVKESDSDADPKDFQNCALAWAAERATGIKMGLAIFPTVAYVPEDRNGDGKFVIYRYAIRKKTHKSIVQFDKTGVFPKGEYTLYPPSKSQTLQARKHSSKRHRQKKAAAEEKISEAIIVGSKPSKSSEHQLTFLEVRNGTGKTNIVGRSLITEQSAV